MNRAVRIACAALFAGTTGCSLILSASSTMAKAESVHVPSAIVWSAVGVLELVSLAGTLRWLTASTARGRLHAIVVVSLAALVTAQAGWSAYGWWGAIAPVAVVVTIHMVNETLTDVPAQRDNQDDHLRAIVAEPWSGPPTEEMPRLDDTRPAEVEEPEPVVGLDPHDDIDWNLSERKLAMSLGITRHAARQLKAERQGVAS